jgi:hypothetical protein
MVGRSVDTVDKLENLGCTAVELRNPSGPMAEVEMVLWSSHYQYVGDACRALLRK